MHLPENTSLQCGRYTIKRFISSGGFGCTYEAEHASLEKHVAIKEFFVKDFCNRDEATAHVTVGTVGKKSLVEKLKKKFLDEAKSLCNLQHSGIVSVSDVFEENGTAYYVMDYIDGLSLGDLLKKQGPLSESVAVGYIRQVCDALKYVHDSHRLHLDIKPGNIMTDSTGKAILIDFGASKQYDEVDGENTSTLMGHTPGYAPLEQMGNDVVKFHPSTDIYALGATLYKLLTGATPLNATRRASGEKLSPLPSKLSSSTRAAVLSAMKLVKDERPQTIDAFLEILDGKVVVEEDERTIIDDENDDVTIPDDPKPTPNPIPTPDENKKKRNEKKEKAAEKSDAPVSVYSMVKKMIIFTGIFVALSIGISFLEVSPFEMVLGGTFLTTTIYLTYRFFLFLKNFVTEIKIYKNKSKEERVGNFPAVAKRAIIFTGIFLLTFIAVKITHNDIFDCLFVGAGCSVLIYIVYRFYKFVRSIISSIRSSAPGSKSLIVTMLAIFTTASVSMSAIYLLNKQSVNYYAVAQPVDLGLSVKWASWNVGANSPEERGGQYAWGETEIKHKCEGSNYEHWGATLGRNICGSEHDVASKKWGDDWRMPTESEINELISQCTWTWITYKGVDGYKVVGRNGNSIFLPMTGWRKEGYIADRDKGLYWAGTLVDEHEYCAATLEFESLNAKCTYSGLREHGRSIRPVKE